MSAFRISSEVRNPQLPLGPKTNRPFRYTTANDEVEKKFEDGVVAMTPEQGEIAVDIAADEFSGPCILFLKQEGNRIVVSRICISRHKYGTSKSASRAMQEQLRAWGFTDFRILSVKAV